MKFGVTGSRGFIGQHLVRFLKEKGEDVAEIPDLHDKDDQTFTHIFHLAGKTSIPESWDNPQGYLEANLLGTLGVLQKAQTLGASVTYVSTCPTTGIAPHPYGFSKGAAEELSVFYAHHFNIPLTILRLANVYGPGQRDSYLVPFVLGQILEPGSPEVVVKDLTPLRDFLYIEDVLQALVRTVPQKPGVRIFNVGTGVYTSVEEVIRTGLKVCNIRKPYTSLQEVRHGEVSYPEMDCHALLKETGWTPGISLEEGLRKMVGVGANRP